MPNVATADLADSAARNHEQQLEVRDPERSLTACNLQQRLM
ncbi:hypothetical protein THAOC_22026, partial [Thalassiosira oceanica]